MIKYIGLFFAISLLFSLHSLGAEEADRCTVKDSLVQVTGRVTGEDLVPLSWVHVVSKESGEKTRTDSIGRFVIHVPPRSTLIFSCEGKVNKRARVKRGRDMEVRMETWDHHSDPSAIPFVKYREGKVFLVAEEMPRFPGGQEACRRFLRGKMNNTPFGHYVSGKAFVTFIVDVNGEITNAEVRRASDEYFSWDALRLVGCMPDWIPGKNKGKPVPVSYTIVVHYDVY